MEDKIKILKAVTDKSRILIINALLEKSMYVEEIAKMVDLAAPTVSFHLKKLEEAGLVYSTKEQYYQMYHIKPEMLEMPLKSFIKVDNVTKTIQDERLKDYRDKVINSFMEYGKLKSIPSQRKKQQIILEEIAKDFEYDRDYTEYEVNIILVKYHDDVCTLRRYMIGERIFDRKDGIYRKLREEEREKQIWKGE